MMMIMTIVTLWIIINGDDDDEQTQGIASRIRKLATLFVIAQWTLGKPVAPDHDHFDEKEEKDLSDDDDSDNNDIHLLPGGI